MTREEFTFTIGFQGDTAIVDRRAKHRYGRMSTAELAEQGLYRAAFCSALFSGSADEMAGFIKFFADRAGVADARAGRLQTEDDLKRLFGVYTVPNEIKRVVSL